MISMRRRMALLLVAGILGVSAVSAPLVYAALRRMLIRQVDAALTSEARALASLVRRDSRGDIEVELEGESLAELSAGRHPAYLEIYTKSGVAAWRSPRLGGADLPFHQAGQAPTRFDVTVPGGLPGRAVQLTVVPEMEDEEGDEAERESADEVAEADGPVALVLARDRDHVDDTLQTLIVGLTASAGLISLLGVLVVAHTVKWGLEPLARLGDQAATADVSALSYRFDPRKLPPELTPICERLNDLLERLAGARERERRFTADVAHELRTPIAELRSLAEVALRWPGDAAAARQSNTDVLDIARQMEAVVTKLLDLARGGASAASRERLRLADVVRAAWSSHAATAQARSLDVVFDVPTDVSIVSDPTLLASLVGNLLANAVEHSPAGGRVRCEAEGAADSLQIRVSNTAGSLAPEDLRHMFEPFWRKDPARSPSGHSGLGLSLVAAYAEVLGLRVDASLGRDMLHVVLRCDVDDASPSRPEVRL